MGKDITKPTKKAYRRDLPKSIQHFKELTDNKFDHRMPKSDGAAHTSNPVCGIIEFNDGEAPAEQVQMTNKNYQFVPSRVEQQASMRPGRASHGHVQDHASASDPNSPRHPPRTRRRIAPTGIDTSMSQNWSGLRSPQNSDYTPTSAEVPPGYPFSPGPGALIQQPIQYGVDLMGGTQHDPFSPPPILQQTCWPAQTDMHLHEDYTLQIHLPDFPMNGYPSSFGGQLSQVPAMRMPTTELPFSYQPSFVHFPQYAEDCDQVLVYSLFDTAQRSLYQN